MSAAYVNATALCKGHGRRWDDYPKQRSAREFMAALRQRLPNVPLIHPTADGVLVHPDLAADVERWAAGTRGHASAGFVYVAACCGRTKIGKTRRRPTERAEEWQTPFPVTLAGVVETQAVDALE